MAQGSPPVFPRECENIPRTCPCKSVSTRDRVHECDERTNAIPFSKKVEISRLTRSSENRFQSRINNEMEICGTTIDALIGLPQTREIMRLRIFVVDARIDSAVRAAYQMLPSTMEYPYLRGCD